MSTSDLIRYALLLSGTQEQSMDHYESQTQQIVDRFKSSLASAAGGAEVAEAALQFIHQEALVRYREEQTELDVLLDTGTYNCVSSAVLYMIVAGEVGVPVMGVQTKDHAFCAVSVDGRIVDVETTNSFGFDPGKKREFQDQFGQTTGYSYVPANRDPSRRETTQKGLLSLILQNQASLYTRRREYVAAVAPAVDAYHISGDQGALEKLIISISNVASALSVEGHYGQAVKFLDEGIGLHGLDVRLVRLRSDVLHNWIVTTIDEGRWDEAEQMVAARRNSDELSEKDWRDMMTTIFQLRAQNLAETEGFLEALLHIRLGIEEVGRDTRLLNASRVYTHNYEVDAHNSMATAFNQGRLQEAKLILERALSYLPESKRLRSDLAIVEKKLATQ
jgi:hypothetical protein